MSRQRNSTPNKQAPHVLWTDHALKKLMELLGKKIPIREIAAKLNKTEKAVRCKCEKLGLSTATTYKKDAPTPESEYKNKAIVKKTRTTAA